MPLDTAAPRFGNLNDPAHPYNNHWSIAMTLGFLAALVVAAVVCHSMTGYNNYESREWSREVCVWGRRDEYGWG